MPKNKAKQATTKTLKYLWREITRESVKNKLKKKKNSLWGL